MPFTMELVRHVEKVPPWAYVVGAGGLLWWMTRDPERHGAQVTPRASEDIQTGPAEDTPYYNPVGAHVPGLPYELGGMCCHPNPHGRTKVYGGEQGGARGLLWWPNPQDDNGTPGQAYGRLGRRGRA